MNINDTLYLNYHKTLKGLQYSNEKALEQKLENDLIRSAQAGNTVAIEELLLKYRGVIAAALENINIPDYELEDLIQEALIVVFRKINTYKFNSKLSTWLYRVARNTGLELYRARKRKLTSTVSIDQHNTDESNARLEIADNTTKLGYSNTEILKHLLKQLSPIQRTCLTLYYYQDYDYNQIAETIRLPLGTVKTHIFRAKQALKQLLEKQNLNLEDLL